MEKNLKNLFKPKSIAIVGATEKEGKVGNVLVKNILGLGYLGKVFLVNPKHKILMEKKCYAALEDIEEDVDLAIISVPAKSVAGVVKNGSDRIKNFVVISAGFSETGEVGKKMETELLAIATEKKLNLLGPNCLGFIVPSIQLNASFASGMSNTGNIALISQSGALAVAFLDMAQKENMRFSSVVSIGNKAQIGEAELIEYFGNDTDTKVIGIYLEGIRDGKAFIESVQKVSKLKPIVILKAGKTKKAQEAITTHTGSLAGSDEIMNVIFSKYGVIRADNLEIFLNTLRFISIADAPINNEVIVITNAGGPGVLTTDSFDGGLMQLAEFDDDTKRKLRELLPVESAVNNPIDLLGDAQEDRYQKTLGIVSDAVAGTIIYILTPQDQTPVSKIAQEIVEFKKRTNKSIVAIFIGGKRIEAAVLELEKNGINNFTFPNQALDVINKYYQWRIFSKINQGNYAFKTDIKRVEKTIEIIKKAQSEGRNVLLFPEARELMKMYEMKVITGNFLTAGDPLPKRMEFPVVVKVESDKILHKSDKNGVILNVNSPEELKEAVKEIREKFVGEAVIIQPMQEVQTELIIGIKKDEIFGPILVVGLGGIYTELFGMVNFLVPPMSVEEIAEFLRNCKISYLFQGARGKSPYNINEVANILFKLMIFCQEIDEIKGLDINPLLIYNNDKEAVAVDVKVLI